jgi:glycosyltransferase involved in cell wall biosynthesis
MSHNLAVVQQYLSWNGHYRQYFENLFDSKHLAVYASNKPENYPDSFWIKSDFDSSKALTIKSKIKGRFLDSYHTYKYLNSRQIGTVHLIEFEPLTYLMFEKGMTKHTRLIITIHSSDQLHFSSWISNKLAFLQRRLLEIALKRAVKRGAHIVTHYQCHKQSISKIIGAKFENRIEVIHYPAPEPASNTCKIFLNPENPRFLIYGQIRDDKGIYEFLQNESTKKLNITIAGRIVDRRIMELADRRGLTIIDKFLSDDEIGSLVDSHDFMLLPYPLEYTNGAGTFKDSLAKAMPVVCSNISIFREIVDQYEVGLIFNDPAEIDNMVKMVTREKYEALSRNCLEYAKKYNWDYMKRSYFAIYDGMRN